MTSTQPTESVHPVFIKAGDMDNSLTPMDLCRAITRVIPATKLEGVQRINNVWRLYVKDRATRLELCVKEKLMINGTSIRLHDQNPNVIYSHANGSSAIHPQKQNDKLTVKNLPLSVSNEEIAKLLTEKKVKAVSPIKYGYIRDEYGQLTTYKSGDRFVYVEPFDPPLPKQQQIGIFRCLLLHHGKETPCKACGLAGHRLGDEACQAKPTEDIVAFRGYEHPLSNHFPCQLKVYGKVFRSVEHAYFWRMATELSKPELAEQIRLAKHAGVAKRLSKNIEDTVRWKWEENNLDIMEHLLTTKADQCEQFQQCLIENQGKILAEATPSKLWGTGVSAFVTQQTSPNYWPGRNMLGAILMELSNQLTSRRESRASDGCISAIHTSDDIEDQHPETPVIDLDKDKQRSNTNEAKSESPSHIAQQTPVVVKSTPSATHRARRTQRTPPSDRTPRSNSTPMMHRGSTGSTMSQQMDIRIAMSQKRKDQASSPDQLECGKDWKVQKGDSGGTS